MEYQISDTESVNSNMSSNVGNCTERLKAPTRVKSKNLGLWRMKQMW